MSTKYIKRARIMEFIRTELLSAVFFVGLAYLFCKIMDVQADSIGFAIALIAITLINATLNIREEDVYILKRYFKRGENI